MRTSEKAYASHPKFYEEQLQALENGPGDMKTVARQDGIAKVDDKGLLSLKGYFDTTPSRVNYDLAFVMSDGEWKLIKINVDVKKPDK